MHSYNICHAFNFVLENGPVAQETIESEEYEEEETEVCLQWNSHHSNMKTSLPSLQMREQYVDCTLSAEGKTIKCHKVYSTL